MKIRFVTLGLLVMSITVHLKAERRPLDYVNTLLGTAPLTNPADIEFKPPWKVWADLVFPGASVPTP